MKTKTVRAGVVSGLTAGAAALLLSGAAGAMSPAAPAAPEMPRSVLMIQGKPISAAASMPGGQIAPQQKGAEAFVQSMAQRALNFLGDEKMTKDQKTAAFRRLLQDSFDMDTIGRFSLGRYWRAASPAQQKEYLSLFREMIVTVYSNRFHEYRGQRFETRAVRADGEKDSIVTAFIIPESGPEVQVDWRVRLKNGRYKVVDVIVEGVSMSVTQRSDFASVIQRGGGDVGVLLVQLRNGQAPSAKSPS